MSSSDIKSTSTMVAIYPPDDFLDLAKKHAHKDMIKDGLHVTLFYVGDTTPEDDDNMIEALQCAMQDLVPIEMYCNGPACFHNDGNFVRLLIMNAVGLDVWRFKILNEMWKKGFVKKQKHGFCGHLTLEYHEGVNLPPEWEKCALEDYPRFEVDRVHLIRANHNIARIHCDGEVIRP